MGATETDILRSVRERVEAQYRDALRALETLGRYLEMNPGEFDGGQTASARPDQPVAPRRRGRKGQGRRARVIEAFRTGWKSIGQVASETGLTTKQVQGVIYAKDLRQFFQQQSGPEGQKYRVKPQRDD